MADRDPTYANKSKSRFLQYADGQCSAQSYLLYELTRIGKRADGDYGQSLDDHSDRLDIHTAQSAVMHCTRCPDKLT